MRCDLSKAQFSIDQNKQAKRCSREHRRTTLQLLPTNHDRYRYEGSLTTPACGEMVHWNVLKTPMTASAEQIKAVGALFSNNARPVLPLNRRFLLDG